MDKILDRERRQREVQAELEHVTALAKLPRLDKAGLSTELRDRLTEWRKLLDGEPVLARQIVRKLVPQRITFTPDPDERCYRFTGTATYGRLLQGSFYKILRPPGPADCEALG